jgi:hypothetical protein
MFIGWIDNNMDENHHFPNHFGWRSPQPNLGFWLLSASRQIVQADILFSGIASWKGFPSEYYFCLLPALASQVSQSSSRISFFGCFMKEDCRCCSGHMIILSPLAMDVPFLYLHLRCLVQVHVSTHHEFKKI